MKNNNWITQYEKMIRSRDKFILLFPIMSDIEVNNLQDSFDEFLINCTHLADWLKESGYKNAYSYRNKNKYLDVCRGLANGKKHFKLDIDRYNYRSNYYRTFLATPKVITQTSSTGQSDQYSHVDNSAPIKPSYPLNNGDFIIETDSFIIDVVDLINLSINSWHGFLRQNGIDYKLL